jgi:hypothetical protein
LLTYIDLSLIPIDKNPPTKEEVDTFGAFDIYELTDKSIDSNLQDRIFVDIKKNIYSKYFAFLLVLILLRDGALILSCEKDETHGEELIKKYTPQERRLIRCPHIQTALQMMILIEKTKAEKDSIGGILNRKMNNIFQELYLQCVLMSLPALESLVLIRYLHGLPF